ncbi:hypothetical protein SC10_B2orf03388 [Bacillus paralicheniformis]|nr:hypothetical protein SC10_B2orf03388 [Bacillus paralicheniformis]
MYMIFSLLYISLSRLICPHHPETRKKRPLIRTLAAFLLIHMFKL